MRYRYIRLWLLYILLGTGLTAGVFLVAHFVALQMRIAKVERFIARFEANPSQSTAEELALLLANKIPTRRQGEQILGLVLSPTATTRSAYPVGIMPTVSIEWPFRLDFTYRRDTYATFKSCLSLEGQPSCLSLCCGSPTGVKSSTQPTMSQVSGDFAPEQAVPASSIAPPS